MYSYRYEEFIDDINILYQEIGDFKLDAILSIARGGVTVGHFLSHMYKIRDLLTLNSIHYDDIKKLDRVFVSNIPDLLPYKRVLIVDDIVDSGESLYEITKLLRERFLDIEFKTAVIFYKKDAIFKPDFKVKEAKEWIEFFWENPLKV